MAALSMRFDLSPEQKCEVRDFLDVNGSGCPMVRPVDVLTASSVAVVLRCSSPDMLAIAADALFQGKLVSADTYQDPGLRQVVHRLPGYSEPARQHGATCYQIGAISWGMLVFALTRHAKLPNITAKRTSSVTLAMLTVHFHKCRLQS